MKLESPFDVGQEVYDGLTYKIRKVIGLSFEIGRTDPEHPTLSRMCWGIWIDSPWLSGGRHPWEISELTDKLRAQLSAATQPTQQNKGNVQ